MNDLVNKFLVAQQGINWKPIGYGLGAAVVLIILTKHFDWLGTN